MFLLKKLSWRKELKCSYIFFHIYLKNSVIEKTKPQAGLGFLKAFRFSCDWLEASIVNYLSY